MSSHENIIFLIVALLIATTAAGVLSMLGSQLQQGNTAASDAELRLVNVLAQNITEEGAHHVRISVTATRGAVSLNNTLITIQMDGGVADLQYREGTLQRDLDEGFYTT
jgi:archaellum component FlaG (FlaF/FlaG flagellin family)